jgi:hypothetical protein
MKRRSFFTVLAAVAAVLLLSGLVGFAWLFAQSPLALLRGSANPHPQAMIFIPQQAPVMGSLLVNVDRLEGLRLALVPPDQRKAQRAEFEAVRDGLLGGGLRYGRDVQPWLGDEVTLAVTTLDIDRDSANGNQPGYLLSLLTKNTTRSREFLQRFWQQRAVVPEDLVFEQYQGTQIIYGQVQSANAAAPALTLASALVGNRFVLFANSPKVLRDAINNVQAVDLNLGNDPDYQRAIAALPANRVGLSYVNLPQLAALSGDTKALDSLSKGTYEHLAIGLGLDRAGLVAHTAVVGGVAQAAQLAKPVAVLRYLPQLTPVVLSGVNLAQTWTDLGQGLQNYQLAKQLVQQPIAAWGQQLQLDLAQDLFPWVKGSYAFGLLPDQAQDRADWIFVADKATNPDYAPGVAKLNAIAKAHQLTVAPVQLGAQTVSAWTQLVATAKSADQPTVDATAIGAWVELDQAVIFASSIAAMQQSLALPQSVRQSLDRSLSQSIAPIDDRNNGYLYVDWRTMKPLLVEKAPIVRIFDLVAQPLAQNLQSVTLSGYGGEGDVHRGVVFLRLR